LEATVVVVDNASSDDSVAVARRHSSVTVIENLTNVGYAVAMNQALRDSDATVLIALNPDTEPSSEALTRLVDRLLSDDDVGLVSPRLVNADGSLQHTAYRFPSVRLAATVCFTPSWLLRRDVGARWWLEGYSPHDRSTDVDWLIGAIHVFRACAVDADGPYRERWFMYVEDLDLCWRLARAGWRRRLEADIAVPHVGNASGDQAWGERRIDRALSGSLDWYAEQHGAIAVRAWAAVNAGGLGLRIVALLPRALWNKAARGHTSYGLRSLSRQLRLHARTVLAGRPRSVPDGADSPLVPR
jgi:GT2 family glycosyltransferase